MVIYVRVVKHHTRVILNFWMVMIFSMLTACTVQQPRPSNDTLFRAAERGDVKAAEEFIKAGVDINERNSDGRSPILLAVMYNKAEMVRLLIRSGADIKTPYRFGESLLHVAINRDSDMAMKELIDAGVNIDARNEKGETSFFIGASLGRKSTSILLNAKADVNARNNDGQTPLISAAVLCNLESIDMLLKSGADVNATDLHGNTALTNAAGIIHTRMISFKVNEERVTATVNKLLNAGANIKAKIQHEGADALLLASREGHTEVVKLLIKAGANVNIKTTIDGYTPLIEAAKGGHKDVVKLLLTAGADPKRKDRIGRNAAMWSTDYPEIVALLGGKPITVKPYQTDVSPEQRKQAEKTLFDLGYRDFTESTFVMSAHNGDVEAAKAFLAYGLRIDSKDSRDHTTTPLLAASMTHNSPELGIFLIKSGANVNVMDENGSTPLIWASQKCQMTELVKALIEAGANVNAKSAGGATPLMMAEIFKCSENFKLLKKKGAKK